MNGVASTLLAIGLTAAYGAGDRVFHDFNRHNPISRHPEDDLDLRGSRRGWWRDAFRRRLNQR
jgi:hypothetical protein